MKTNEFSATSAPHTPTQAINGKERNEKFNMKTATRAQNNMKTY
ncbi:hypothetical protein [uncultured Prevotella sp.]|nr:hypothetical protein [uncultured Prevotella sp.]